MNLFSSEENRFIDLGLTDATVHYYPSFFTSEEAAAYFNILRKETPWQQDDITLFGKTYAQPRLTALYGNNGKAYRYSGITMKPHRFTETLSEIKLKIEQVTEVAFTTVLLNLYRDGNDSNGWHSDDEKELGKNPVIASVSFGTPRVFQLKHKKDNTLKHKLILESGSLLVMKGATQENWKHQIPKSKKVTDARINATFRVLH